MSHTTINCETSFFTAQQQEAVLQVHFKELQATWIGKADGLRDFLSYLDLVVVQQDIKVVLLLHPLGRIAESRYYFKVVDLLKRKRVPMGLLQNFFEVLDQYMLHIVESNKFFIDVHAGNLILDTFMTSFACDYRILADNTILKNPGIQMGVVPKGTGMFLSCNICNTTEAYRMLLTEEHQNAYELLRRGFVNQVINLNKLEDKALEVARDFASKTGASLGGIKHIVNSGFHQLKESLDIENQELTHVAAQW